MARYQVILAYDGTDFFGFQRQANARTVQSVFEDTLVTLGWHGKSILAAGRTDAGVHAAGQVVAFDLDWVHSGHELLQALNARLPLDVAVQAVRQVHSGFHPRYDAAGRCYHYRLFASPVRQPLMERFAWRIKPDLQMDLLSKASSLLVGTFDFAAFGSPPKKGGTTIRTISRAEWLLEGNLLTFVIHGNAFLFRMVRRLVAFQVAIARQKLPLESLTQHLAKPGDTSIVGIAPACGLTLFEVYYLPEKVDEFPGRHE
jgi:tRNA pseudouridine38-40 synthase